MILESAQYTSPLKLGGVLKCRVTVRTEALILLLLLLLLQACGGGLAAQQFREQNRTARISDDPGAIARMHMLIISYR
jgi:hypothetical protein